MNRVFKVLWSPTLGEWVITSELGRSNKKSKLFMPKSVLKKIALISSLSMLAINVVSATIAVENGSLVINGPADIVPVSTVTGKPMSGGVVFGTENKIENTASGNNLGNIVLGNKIDVKGISNTLTGNNLQLEGYDNVGTVAVSISNTQAALILAAEADGVEVSGLKELLNSPLYQDYVYAVSMGKDYEALAEELTEYIEQNTQIAEQNVLLRDWADKNEDKIQEIANSAGAKVKGANNTFVGSTISIKGNSNVAQGSVITLTGSNSIALGTAIAVSANSAVALGEGTTVIKDAGIAIGKNSKVEHENSLALGQNSITERDNSLSIGSEGNERQITYVAKGSISETSTDAVNGSQLHATNTNVENLDGRVTTNEGNISTIQGDITNITSGKSGLLQLKDGKLVFSEAGAGAIFDIADGEEARTLTGVKAGAVADDSVDAINGSQLYATNQSIVDSLGGGAELNEDGSINGPTYVINKGDSYNNVGDAITNIDGRVINNTENITNLTENMSNITTGKAGLVMIEGDRIVFDSSIAGDRVFDISNNGQARKMTGVADGAIATGSKDAINGGQLYDTNQKVATNTANIGKNTDALGGGAGIDKDGNYTGPNYSFNDGTNHTNVGSALDNLDGRVTDLDQRVEGITNGTEGLVKLETDDQGNQKLVIDNKLASKAGTFDISNGEDGRTLTGVNEGKVKSDSKDAINGSQLHTSNSSIADIFGGGASIDKDGYVSMPEYNFGDDNKFNNVGDSLTHLNKKIQKGEGGLFQMSADGKTVVLGDTAKTAKTVDMGNRVVAGVANGRVEKNSLEAVNGGQLWETNQQVGSNTNQIKHINNTLNHYNTRIGNLEKTVHENRKRASAGTASAMAMSSIPYLDYAKYSFGMGVASYDGEAAMSMGLEFKMGDNGRFRIQGSYDTQSKAGVGVGMAFEL